MVLAAAVTVIACGGSPAPAGSTRKQPPTANIQPLDRLGQAEGALDLVTPPGYLDDSWVKPFEAETGCQVNHKDAGSTDEMVSLMQDGGAGQWDMVSAPGDIGLQLVYAGDVKPMNPALVPDWRDFAPYFKAPPYNTINGIHYGISGQWRPNTLLYSTRKFPNKPTSWSVIYDPANSGVITVPDNPMQIADAGLYLSRSEPGLGITDPYELTRAQFDAAVELLTRQRPLVKRYWTLPSDEIALFKSGDVFAGAAWPHLTIELKASGAPVDETVPREGATGSGDTWMLARRAPHPNCAYLWTAYVSTAKVQALQALFLGETPVNSKACAEMEALDAGSCAEYHADQTSSAYFGAIKFWKTPLASCDDGRDDCVPYAEWVSAWAAIKA